MAETSTDELKELKAWRDAIGIPTQQQNEQLKIINEGLKTEIKALSLELQTYRVEFDKLQSDNKELREQLRNDLEKGHMDEQIRSLHTLQDLEQEHAHDLEIVQFQYEALKKQSVKDRDKINSLITENNELKKQNKQYNVILDQLQQEEDTLKDKMSKEHNQLEELRDAYQKLDSKLHQQQSFAKHQKSFADELVSELSDLNKIAPQMQVENNSNDNDQNSWLASGGNIGKTIRVAPKTMKTLHFKQIPSDTLMNALAQDTFHQNADFVDFDEFGKPLAVILDPYEMDAINEMKTKLESEHKAEITALKQEIEEYTEKLTQQDIDIQKLQNKLSELEHRDRTFKTQRTFHNQNPNNEQNMSTCKVFGVSIW